MKKQFLLAMLLALIFTIFSCQKQDLLSDSATSPAGENLTTSTQTLSSIVGANCDVISFETAAAGTLVSSITSDGGVVIPMTSRNTSAYPAQPIAAMIFDSDEPDSEDLDLGTPSEPIGPGEVNGGQSRLGQATNTEYLHNILIIQNFQDRGTTIPNDDDNRDGINEYITFDFSSVAPVIASSITVIDVEVIEESESGNVILYDAAGGEIRSFPFPNTWENGVGIIDLENTPGVYSIKLDINGSIGFDNLRFCIPTTPPPPPPTGCTRTQGYWKTHGPDPKGKNSNEWNVSQMTLGTVSYNASQLLSIMNQPVKGNGLVSLAHQLIAANLNIAEGASDASISAVIDEANLLIGGLIIPPVAGAGYLQPSATSRLVDLLTRYNEGTLRGGPPHCK